MYPALMAHQDLKDLPAPVVHPEHLDEMDHQDDLDLPELPDLRAKPPKDL